MFLRQALRYRWSQALVLAGVSLLIGTCAAFAPWFARAVEQTVTTESLTNQWISAAWQLEAVPPPTTAGASVAKQPEDLAQLIPADLKPLFMSPIAGLNADLVWGLKGDRPEIEGRLLWRDDICAQLVLVKGRCPQRSNEVAASTVDAKAFGAGLGAVIDSKAREYVGGGGRLTVVGIYQPVDQQAPYWFGRGPVGHSEPETFKAPAQSDYFLTGRDTFSKGVWGYHSTLDTRPLPGVARVDDLARLKEATTQVGAKAEQLHAQNVSSLVGVIDTIQAERKQATTITPLVMVQVALFGVGLLALALGAVVDQRRPELAVARLRGLSARRTGWLFVVELGAPVLAGMLGGVVTGFGLLLVVRATWLSNGASVELPWTVPAAIGAAIAAGLAVVVWSVRAVVRQPISILLRRVVPRRRNLAIGVIDLIIIVVASAGLVAALTGGGRGPLPVLTPSLLALAVGLTFAHLLLPIAALISRRALRQGRLGLALGALQVSRRPAVTRIVAVVAVATALVTFAGQAASVAGHNRETRAGYESGAEAVLTMNVNHLGDFTRAIDSIDRDRNWLTPVVVARPPSPDALLALMIEPDSFRRVAFRGDRLTDAEGFAALKAPTAPEPIEVRGDKLTATISTGPMKPVIPPTFNWEAPPPQPPAKSVILQANVVSLRTGARNLVRFPPVPLVPGKSFELTTDLPCQAGCRLVRLGIARDVGDPAGIRGDVHVSKLTAGTPIQLGRPEDWKPIKHIAGDPGAIAAKPGPGGGLTIDVASVANEQDLQYAAVPVTVPALVTPDFAYSDSATVPGIDGSAVPIQKLDRLRGPVNRYAERAAVVDLETVRRLGGSVDEGATEFELWLNSAGLANADQIIDGLAKAGITATLSDQRADRIASYGRSASALALRLTPVVGIAGWSLAIIVLLLMVVTSWRSRAQDYASLRITGVPAGTTGRAARWEQTGPVALAALLGSICGIVGAHIALPMIPLFAQTARPSPIPLDLATNWVVVLVLWLIGTAVLTTTTLLLGSGVNRRASYGRIREEM